LLWIACCTATTGSAAEGPDPAVPELSLQSIYHPEDKFDFDGELPRWHWIGPANSAVAGVDPAVRNSQPSDSQFLVQRDDQWMVVDLATGHESVWPLADRLAEQLAKLGGLNGDQLQTATSAAVQSLRHPADAGVVKIDKSLAVVSASAPARWLTRDGSAWKNTTIDPSGRRIGYTRDGDLFLLDIASGQTYRMTNDGTDTILDGLLDWTYQEEIFGRGNYQGFWFSHDGEWLAMLRVDISAIEPYTLSSATAERGRGIVRRYPKAGDPIPHASLWVWDLRQSSGGVLPPPKLVAQSTADQPRIISGVWWAPDRTALVYSVNDRVQSWRELRMLDSAFLIGQTNEANLLLREQGATWIEPPAAPQWYPDGSLLWRSELATGRYRLYRIDVAGKLVSPVSPPDFHVQEFKLRPDGGIVVTGNADPDSADRHAYRIDPTAPQSLIPITTAAGWHEVDFSPEGSWMTTRFSTATQPPELSLRSTDGETKHMIAAADLPRLPPLIVPKMPRIVTPDGVVLPALLIRPETATDTDPVPIVIEVYGGPQTPAVVNRWEGKRTLYRQLLAARGIGTLVIDNRSSAGRGPIDSWPIHRRVGEIEWQDLSVGVEWLKQQPWVDSNRLAIRGWSFGGFLTLYAMTHSDAFAVGIAGGSVTDWREYDAFYTERYMGLPSDNEAGYDATAPVRHADKLQGRVLLIHGEADDNVHPSGTMRMARALQMAGKDFQLMIYPGAGHGVTNGKQVWHLARMTDQFLVDQLIDQSSVVTAQ
jgi:dipeptidyl-peptidase-4